MSNEMKFEDCTFVDSRRRFDNPHAITEEFERQLCAYTGARFAVATTSCTMALLLALAYRRRHYIGDAYIPKHTYVGVAASCLNAGFKVRFEDVDWTGGYEIKDLGVWDYARRFTSGMSANLDGAMHCVSFHWAKLLSISQAGAVLHDDPKADAWLRRARFDGRTAGVDPKDDTIQYPSWHAYLSPEVAAHGLMKLSLLPKHNADLPRSDYPPLDQFEAFK